jgi:protease-4
MPDEANSGVPPVPPSPSVPPAAVPPAPAPRLPSGPPARLPAKPPRRSRVALWVVLGLLGFFGLLLLLVALVAAAFMGSSSIQVSGPRTLHEEVLESGGTERIAVVEVQGLIYEGGTSLFGPAANMVEGVVKRLRQAAADPNVKAVVLAVDSPGGTVTGSDLIWHEVTKFKKTGKKVVVHMGDLAASGGYYVSAPADRIVCSPTAITGSIGVIWPCYDASALMEQKLGVKANPIKTGPYKDIGSMSRPMRPDEQELLQAVLNDMYERFLDIVTEGRQGHGDLPQTKEEAKAAIRKLADGRIYTAQQALANGLVDALGYREDAYAEAKSLTGQPNATIVRYRQPFGVLEVLMGNAEGRVNINTGVQIDAEALSRRLIPRLEYRWDPAR